MKNSTSGKIILFMIFFSVFSFGQISFDGENVLGIKNVKAVDTCVNELEVCGPGETIFNCKDECLSAGIPDKPILEILDSVIEWILGLGLVLSVVFLIWGGINYVASSGDTSKADSSKKIIKFSILGVIVMGVSYAIVMVIKNLLIP